MIQKRILVVDDDHFVRLALKKELEEGAYAVDLAESGRQALDVARHADYDLVFIDLVMPGLNGIETTKALRSLRPNTKIVCFTGIFDRQLTKRAADFIDAGEKTLLLYKPFRKHAFIETAHRLLN